MRPAREGRLEVLYLGFGVTEALHGNSRLRKNEPACTRNLAEGSPLRAPPDTIAFREQSGRILETLMGKLHRTRVSLGPMLESARTLMARAQDPSDGRERFKAE